MRLLLLCGVLLAACESPVTQISQIFEVDTSKALKVQTEDDGPFAGNQRGYASVTISPDQENLALQTNISTYTRGKMPDGKEPVAAASLLSPYAESAAYQKTAFAGPNCWHTSIASLFPTFGETRFLGDKEFACHLKTSFKETTSPKFGDVIRLQDNKGNEVHGATFVGVDAITGDIVAFTKNGYDTRFPFVFMSLKKLTEKIYPETTKVSYWTPTREVKNPEREGMDCYQESVASRAENEELRYLPPYDPLTD